ncbi:TonB-dependent receptor [uncultured Duncaniella sp.]|uniref:TonB-dependent receptor domain-containing protein n=1 Tax=uncultured Duncaniella sp. TaxID=2768039 RepID=UPI0034287B04
MDGKDMIQTVKEKNPYTGGQMLNKNIGDFRNKGFEIETAYSITPDLTLSANYSYLHTTDNVLYAPKNKLVVQLSYRPGNWQFALDSNSVWHLRTGGPDPESYSLLDGLVGYNFQLQKGCRLNVFTKVDNITATRYETIYGFPMPRATAMAGFSLTF